MSERRFEEKVAVITGAGEGLGQATALRLACEGAKLSLIDIHMERLKNTEKMILTTYPETEILLIAADVAKEDKVREYVEATVERFQHIHAFYNNAGITEKLAYLEDYEEASFHHILQVNLNGVFYGLKYVLPVMKKQQEGAIVNAASIAGIRGVVRRSGYVATKHAVVGLTKTAALEYASHGISINAIAPGRIMTEMVKNSFKERNPDHWEESARQFARDVPAKRLGTPEEVAALVAFLLSGEAPYINGTVISIDGGLSSKFE